MEEDFEKKENKFWSSWKFWLGIIILILLVLFLLTADFDRVSRDEIPDDADIQAIDENVGVYYPGEDEDGPEIAPGIPDEILTEAREDAEIRDTYSLRYFKEGFDQPYLEYKSQSDLGANVDVMERALEDAGWEILHNGEIGEGVINTYIYASRGNEYINISLTAEDLETSVKISYTDLPDEYPEEEL